MKTLKTVNELHSVAGVGNKIRTLYPATFFSANCTTMVDKVIYDKVIWYIYEVYR